ncbi:MAG: HYR domain-containing protein, partial [Phycisphaerae bacterium]
MPAHSAFSLRRVLAFIALAIGVEAAAQVQIIVPPGSGIRDFGVRPIPSWIEHYPLENHVSFDMFFSTPDAALTLTGGRVEFFDANGNTVDGPTNFTPTTFATYAVSLRDGNNPQQPDPPPMISIDGNLNAVIPIESRILFFCPDEVVGHNIVPATARVDLFFQEFVEPLTWIDIEIREYRTPPGATFTFGLAGPSVQDGLFYIGNAHTLGTAHRGAFNQRYAYDVGVRVEGSSCDDCDELSGHYVYGETIIAVAPGIVVVNETGHPENDPPGSSQPGIGDCLPERCDGTTVNPCSTPADGIPGGGNMMCLQHGNGEWSFYAHAITGSNDFLLCDAAIPRGGPLGQAGSSGSSGGPHLHFQSVDMPSPDDPGAQSLPIYFTNVIFPSPGQFLSRRQLEVGIFPNSYFLTTPAPVEPPSNAPTGPGMINEVEPNDFWSSHQTLVLPALVQGTAELQLFGEFAVRGDGIEDVFRVNVATHTSLTVELFDFPAGQNLDVYVLTADLRVMNPTGQGTSRGLSERVCVECEPGSYYIMVTNVDNTQSGAAPYSMRVTDEPLTIVCGIEAGPVEVDDDCVASVSFSALITDNCCLDPNNLNLTIDATIPTNNATVQAVLPLVQPISDTVVQVSGVVLVRDLRGCPAVLRLEFDASDCEGNRARTPCVVSTTVVDPTPPTITCEVLNLPQPVRVDNNCEALIRFQAFIDDQCCVDPASYDLQVIASNPSNNATLGPVQLDPPVQLGPRRVRVSGSVLVSDLTSCPARIELRFDARDCCENPAMQCLATVDVIDDIPPVITCPPDIRVPFGNKICDSAVQDWLDSTTATDNCDPDVAIVNDAPDCGFPCGTTTLVTWTATDDCGNSSQCSASITVDPCERATPSQKGSLLIYPKVEVR